ncbi:methionine synthase [Silvanigrella paludirubra]|uniref:Methionine synthase n=1 Tax=Silvanigrella paludirubra TaxID=2499159 RepID=A0A6N6VNX2_9BACT|nr:methionine synthase [Silvanigrella paludirubra]KAB8036515.1 methionine synthase [Silvanigrella paludirubra]
MKKTISEAIKERVLILDGAMGTQIFNHNPTIEDYGGIEFDGCVELLNERRKNWIQEIHHNYFQAGCDAVETNTFGCNEIVLSEFGIANRTLELNIQAAKLAKEVANSYQSSKYVIGSVGPGTKLITLLQIDYKTLYQSYYTQMKGLLLGGVDVILIETCQDINQVKIAVRAAKKAMNEVNKQVPIWTQVTIETSGTMLVGSDIQSALTAIECLGVDVLGMNCATGPDEMRQHIAYLAEASPFALSVLPNAGLPQNVSGKTVYPLGPVDFATKVITMAKDFSLNVIGGCCGTTPEHIKELVNQASSLNPGIRKGKYERSVSSLYTSVPLDLEPKPLYVGERTNANGSKKFRDLLAINDYDGLVQIAKGQLKEGAHILDVCVAYVSRNETEDMELLLKKLVTQVNIPIMIDSTEIPVIERALQIAPGKCVVNSINFEDGEEKARKILDLCKEYGASIVALTIDEEGMAKTVERKLNIAERIYNLVVHEYKMNPGDLIFDPLTFTLGSGDEEFRKSAIATIDGIKLIKEKFKGVRTILGLSNVSFGLNPYTRQILNSLMLYHSVKNGLDLAILNASKIIPVAKISEEDRKLFNDLIFDKRSEDYDPLKKILQKFSDVKKDLNQETTKRNSLSVEERLKLDIIDGEKQYIFEDCKEALNKYPPLHIINNILLEGMKVVGERFGAGEMQLPFVLESAEAMKTAVRELEPYMEKKSGYSKGKMIIATVKGDVHDIGKNLVDVILSNNGFEILNLGIKQPIESILEKYKGSGAHVIGMSGLLVKSTAIMKENLEYMALHNHSIPVILGGAALTREFVEKECQSVYKGPVFYAFDAFESLKIMEKICDLKQEELTPEKISEIRKYAKATEKGAESDKKEPDNQIKVIRKSEKTMQADENGQSPWVRKNEKIPIPPFWGTKIKEEPLKNIFEYIDEFALIRSRWGFSQGNMTEEQFTEILKNKAQPLFEQMKKKFIEENVITPKAIYGYFPVCSENDKLIVYEPNTREGTPVESRKIIAEFYFPRQKSGKILCISDYFQNIKSGKIDTLGVQIVTLGEEISHITKKLYDDGNFTEYYYLHGIATELTEAYAEVIHKLIRTELGIVGNDAKSLRQLFSQGYQGSRFSFGYPACPNMEGNNTLLNLLEADRIGVKISEAFQMHPELTTSALVSWHPQARYFTT